MRICTVVLCSTLAMAASIASAASVGAEVTQFSQGIASGVVAPYTNPSGAVGLPVGDTGYGALTPFNPAFSTSHLLGIGAGGSATIRLSGPILINSTAKLGVFENTGIVDVDPESAFDGFFNFTAGGRGIVGNPPRTFGGGIASVSVSSDGVNFVPVTALPIEFNIPSTAYTDNDINLGLGTIGTQPTDYFKPFTGTLSDFANLRYNDPDSNPDMLTLLDGSAGGTWLDLSSIPLGTVSYVRFDVPDNGRLLIDAVTAIPEPAALSMGLAFTFIVRRRR